MKAGMHLQKLISQRRVQGNESERRLENWGEISNKGCSMVYLKKEDI